jgi:hypothetical protein
MQVVVRLVLGDLLRLGGPGRRGNGRSGLRLGARREQERGGEEAVRCRPPCWSRAPRSYRCDAPAPAWRDENSRKNPTMPSIISFAESPSVSKSADSSQIPPQLSHVS